MRLIALLALGGFVLAGCKPAHIGGSELREDDGGSGGYEAEAQYLKPNEKRGRDIWYKAVAGGDRFHQYPYQQRFGVYLNWNKLFDTDMRGKRFGSYGVIQDPDCKPGNESSFGWDICPGDGGENGLLAHVGKPGWKDPGCSINESDVPGGGDNRQSGCDLAFGTSTGGLGFRKFPNRRFKKDKWPGWEKYDPRDASVEPPFLVGQACGACHIGFNPNKPPQDPENPTWANISGLVGNQYLFMSEVLATAMPHNSLEWQIFTHARPGTTDTSAIPHDMVNNPGTINAIISTDKRPPLPEMLTGKSNPTFENEIKRWRRVDSCGSDNTNCMCAGKGCWQLGTKTETVPGILKGGEDNVGADLAVQRVYVNIGTCSEQCWLNHLMDFRSLAGRGKYQTPFDVAQCRRDCPNWRAIEDRVFDIFAFLLTPRPTDLKDAVGAESLDKLIESEHVGGREVWEKGKETFAKECARCHSSQKPKLPGQPRDEEFFLSLDFHAEDENGNRIDWLGNDELTPAAEIESNHCRALHSNHMKGSVWEEFASETYRGRKTDERIDELKNKQGGGRGFYRNISLLSLWAHAPFMHNNAIGPEICNDQFYTGPWACVQPDPSVKGRLKLYEASMNMLLNPSERLKKVTRTDRDIVIPIGPKFWTGNPSDLLASATLGNVNQEQLKGLEIKLPKGTPVTYLASLDFKKMIDDWMAEVAGQSSVQARWAKIRDMSQKMYSDTAYREQMLAKYSNCRDLVEDKGHEFGVDLPDDEKKALIAFLKTI